MVTSMAPNYINSQVMVTSMAPNPINSLGLMASMAPNPINYEVGCVFEVWSAPEACGGGSPPHF